jgi:multiple sugar transport system permease protein
MVIFIAGIQNIPASLYEAAEIDGAGRVSRFFRITFPMLTPVVFFNLIMQTINAFQAFTPAFIISKGSGGFRDSILFYTLYLYRMGFVDYKMGYASAMAWFLLVIIGLIAAVLFASSRFWVYYDE